MKLQKKIRLSKWKVFIIIDIHESAIWRVIFYSMNLALFTVYTICIERHFEGYKKEREKEDMLQFPERGDSKKQTKNYENNRKF